MHILQKERSKMNNLSFDLRKLEKEGQIKSKISIRKEIIKISAEIHEIGNRKSIQKIHETKSHLSKNINKIISL
jgi:hypothetical protein